MELDSDDDLPTLPKRHRFSSTDETPTSAVGPPSMRCCILLVHDTLALIIIISSSTSTSGAGLSMRWGCNIILVCDTDRVLITYSII